MDPYLDFWNYMGFDYAGAWENVTAHSGNLFATEDNPEVTPFNTSEAMNYYLTTGATPSKINLGNPLYCHGFPNTTGPGMFGWAGTEGSFGIAGTWDYKDLPVAGYNASVIEMSELGASYSFDEKREYVVSYDTPNIARQKAEWVVSMGLEGAMWWEISQDKMGSESLVGATVEAFGGRRALEGSVNHLRFPGSRYENLRLGMPRE